MFDNSLKPAVGIFALLENNSILGFMYNIITHFYRVKISVISEYYVLEVYFVYVKEY